MHFETVILGSGRLVSQIGDIFVQINNNKPSTQRSRCRNCPNPAQHFLATPIHERILRGVLMPATETTLKPVNFLVNFWDILTAPSLALKRVSTVQTRSWWFPVLLSLATPLLHLALTMPMQIERMQKMMALQMSNMSPEQAEAARPMLERMTQPNALLLTTTTQVALGLAFAWAVGMLILYFGIALLGTPLKPNGLWAALTWTWIPFAIRPLVQLAWNLYTQSLIVYPGVSFFFATGKLAEDQRNPLFIAATHVDIFALWHLILIYLLLRVIGKLGTGSSFFLTLLYAIVQLGVRLIPVLVTHFTSMG